MGMSIDEALNYLIAPKTADTIIGTEKQKQFDAYNMARDIMFKYQKIKEIVIDYDLEGMLSEEEAFIKIIKIIRDSVSKGD